MATDVSDQELLGRELLRLHQLYPSFRLSEIHDALIESRETNVPMSQVLMDNMA